MDRDAPPEYLIGHIEDALARDPRVTEQGLRVDVAGDPPAVVVVTGTVTDALHKESIADVVHDVLPGAEVRDATTLADYPEDGAPELVP